MAQSNSSAHWQKKGFGWIPDLPDIADPSLTLALNNKTRILSQEGTEHLENIANLAKLLQDLKPESAEQLDKIYKQSLGETSFPYVQVYKILRKSEQLENKKVAPLYESHAKEIIQLKQSLYWIYREFFIHKNAKDKKSLELDQDSYNTFNKLFHEKSSALIEWLQDPNFDPTLEEIVIDFQGKNSLVEDGIVGIRTYSAIKAKLVNPEESFKEGNIELLCPSSIIPHDILVEVFQELTYIWLCAKFELSISRTFEYFYGQYPLSSGQSDYTVRIQVELNFIIHEHLKVISHNFRDSIRKLPQDQSIKLLEEGLNHLKAELINKSSELTIIAYQNLDNDFKTHALSQSPEQQSPTPSPVRPLFEELHRLLSTRLAELVETLCGESNTSNLENSFIICSDEDFINQFQMWFHVIEPFVSAIFQILSPLANYDNYHQAISTGFGKLDSCFQLYQLEYASKVGKYKNLFLESSSTQISDHVEELQELRKTIVFLFEETIAKIDRIQKENLNYRPCFLDSLEKLLKEDIDKYFRSRKKGESLSNRWQSYSNSIPPDWLDKVEQDLRSTMPELLVDNEQINHLRNLASLFIGPRLYELAHKLSKLQLEEKAEAYKKFVQDELSEDRNNVQRYVRFFVFLKEVIAQKYGIRLKPVTTSRDDGSTDQVPANKISGDGIDRSSSKSTDGSNLAGTSYDKIDAELISFLTSKKELFEIQDVDLQTSDAPQGGKGSKALFFEPTVLQLPVNGNIMKKITNPAQNPTRFYFFLPGLVDLSYWCPPIEDQGDVNACTAFAGVSLLEYFAHKQHGKYTNLSARFLYKTARNLMNRSDDTGASVRQTMKALVLFGVPPEEAWPWHTEAFNEEPPAFCYAYAQSYQALKYFRLDAASSGAKETSISSRELLLFQIKAVLAAGLPCIFGFTVYSSFYKDRNIRLGYIPYPSSRDQVMGGHAAVAVGYNDYKRIDRMDGEPTKPGAILIRNSWGSSWGNGGYGWIPYEYILEGLTADWWSLLKSEWFDGGAFGLGAVDPGAPPANLRYSQ